jgi:hypothetical protein
MKLYVRGPRGSLRRSQAIANDSELPGNEVVRLLHNTNGNATVEYRNRHV